VPDRAQATAAFTVASSRIFKYSKLNIPGNLDMPLYIKDDAVADLVAKFAKLRGVSKQAAVGLAVQAELDRAAEAIPLRDRFAALRKALPLPPSTGELADKAFFEAVEVEDALQHQPFRMPVQWVSRPDLDFRGFAGQIAGGTVRPGDQVRVLPSGRVSTVARIVTFDGDLPEAVAGQSVTVTLADEVDISRGDVLAAADDSPEVADEFEATLVWMAEEPLQVGRPYLFKTGARTVTATIGAPDHKVDVNTMEEQPATTLELNEIGVVTLSLDREVAFDPYVENRDLGGFILIDRLTNSTVGAGMLRKASRKADNVHWQAVDVDQAAHASLKGQKPCVVWFTGLPSAGKSTIANLVESRLHALGRHTYLLDGDNVRHGLNKDLGFTAEDRVENIRRVGEVAQLMADAGLIVLVTLVSPYRADRDHVRSRLPEGEFFEVFVDAPLAVVQERDPKGLYRKAAEGLATNVTGVDAPYEAPLSPELHLDTAENPAATNAAKVIDALSAAGMLSL